ncbi:MAG: TRAM domain-containing protein [Armatimonadota bacterium]|nr:TRAM domain-containing protein [Armatimonadota bacterium]MDR7486926.1 TRAM domain-containing protein [Armatimonadota bacterium]MDR7534544.1 TRAM domain-containing protein [Armatimonadota bacterium]MDR7537637.1 TRAM domain-containing protein [Armatimonadota bacterium]
MRDSVMRAVGALLGGVAGYQIALLAGEYWTSVAAAGFRPQALGVILGGLVGLLAVPPLSRAFVAAMAWVLHPLAGLSLHDLILGGLGLVVGLMLALFVGYLLEGMPLIGPYVRLVAGVVLGYLGLHVALQRRDELAGILRRQDGPVAGPRGHAHPKLLDTSVVIDGRIADICRAGFLEGPLLVPRSVLTELQRIADSADAVRRNRGRRGLDILNRLRRELDSVQVIEDIGDALDVDAQLIALARAHDAWVVTNDFNLSKVAELQGVRVLNVNELAQAVRPTVLPGEELTVQVIRDGKEAGQGIAYLDDGTMIVVEGGKRLIGETSEVVVTSMLQTSAGRMIFARPKSSEPTGPSSLPKR